MVPVISATCIIGSFSEVVVSKLPDSHECVEISGEQQTGTTGVRCIHWFSPAPTLLQLVVLMSVTSCGSGDDELKYIIIGAVLGGVVLLALAALLVFYLYRTRRIRALDGLFRAGEL